MQTLTYVRGEEAVRVSLQQTGQGSYYVYIPKTWITSIGLKKGDPLFVSLGESHILVWPPYPRLGNENHLEQFPVGEDPSDLHWTIVSAYVGGTLQAKVYRKDSKPLSPAQRVRASEALRRLPGIESTVLDQAVDFRDITDYSRFNHSQEIERLFRAVRDMARLTYDLLRTRPEDTIPLAHLLHDTYVAEQENVDPQSFYIHRSMNVLLRYPFLGSRVFEQSSTEIQFAGIVSYILERLSDSFYSSGQLVAEIFGADNTKDLLKYPPEFIATKIGSRKRKPSANLLDGFATETRLLGDFLERAQIVVCNHNVSEAFRLQSDISAWRVKLGEKMKGQEWEHDSVQILHRLREASTYIESLANRTIQFYFNRTDNLSGQKAKSSLMSGRLNPR